MQDFFVSRIPFLDTETRSQLVGNRRFFEKNALRESTAHSCQTENVQISNGGNVYRGWIQGRFVMMGALCERNNPLNLQVMLCYTKNNLEDFRIHSGLPKACLASIYLSLQPIDTPAICQAVRAHD